MIVQYSGRLLKQFKPWNQIMIPKHHYRVIIIINREISNPNSKGFMLMISIAIKTFCLHDIGDGRNTITTGYNVVEEIIDEEIPFTIRNLVIFLLEFRFLNIFKIYFVIFYIIMLLVFVYESL